ncbi:major facilitator superfamily domain-containing protein [Xylariales sp. AK1849]|nr:major facilitator superfamily domain-containing protein [Xylariales sp. AK1849]
MATNVPPMPVNAVSSSGVALLVGGGLSVAEAMVFSMLSDVSTDRWRTISFQVVICSVLLAELVGAVSAELMMNGLSSYAPLWWSLIFNGVGLFLVLFLPETLHMRRTNPLERPESSIPILKRREKISLRTTLRDVRGVTKAAWFFMRAPDIRLLIPAATFTLPLATASMSLLSRVIPARSGLTYNDSSTMVIVRAATTIGVLAVALPLVFYFWRRRAPFTRDLTLARVSCLFLFVGMVIIGAVPSLDGTTAGVAVFTLGAAVPGLARSLLSQMIPKSHLGMFFGLLAVLEQLGFLVLGLATGALLEAGVRNGAGAWLGLPFYFSGVLFLIVDICLWCTKARPLRVAEDVELDDMEVHNQAMRSDPSLILGRSHGRHT